MPAWPLTLPQTPLIAGFQTSPKPNLISFGTEVGPGKVRRRTTARSKLQNIKFVMTTAQLNTFQTFFEDDLGDGALTFTLEDPVTEVVSEYRFDPQRPWNATALGADNWEFTASIELMP